MNNQRTIKFINTDASSIHGNLKVGSVYTSESGEWKLGGFEVLSSVKEDESAIYVSTHHTPIVGTEHTLTLREDIRKLSSRFRTICTTRAGSRRMGCHQKEPTLSRGLVQLWCANI
jgi:hypothetical protein